LVCVLPIAPPALPAPPLAVVAPPAFVVPSADELSIGVPSVLAAPPFVAPVAVLVAPVLEPSAVDVAEFDAPSVVVVLPEVVPMPAALDVSVAALVASVGVPGLADSPHPVAPRPIKSAVSPSAR
jgi:hypothetical protein